jgi:hypothetical protein
MMIVHQKFKFKDFLRNKNFFKKQVEKFEFFILIEKNNRDLDWKFFIYFSFNNYIIFLFRE